MKKSILLLIISLFFYYCQTTPFDSKTQAKNEVNKNGYRVGRWVDFLDSTGNKTNDKVNFTSYILSEYTDGKPDGIFKEFNKDNSIKKKGKFKITSGLYEKQTIPSKYTGDILYFSNDKIDKKDIYDSDGDIILKVFYEKNTETNSTDSSFVETKYYPSKKIESITFSGRGNVIKFEYDENPWYMGLRRGDEFIKELHNSPYMDFSKQEIWKSCGSLLSDLIIEKVKDKSFIENVHYLGLRGERKEMFDLYKKGYKTWLSDNKSIVSSKSSSDNDVRLGIYVAIDHSTGEYYDITNGIHTYLVLNGKKVFILAMGSDPNSSINNPRNWATNGSYEVEGNYLKLSNGKTWELRNSKYIRTGGGFDFQWIKDFD